MEKDNVSCSSTHYNVYSPILYKSFLSFASFQFQLSNIKLILTKVKLIKIFISNSVCYNTWIKLKSMFSVFSAAI